MSTEKTARIDSQRNHETVIDAALDLLSEQPNASMAAIAEHSGLGRTTVYRHFPNRDDLIRAIFERIVAEAQAATSAVIDRDLPAREILFELGAAIIGIGHRFQFLADARNVGDEVILESTLNPDDPVRHFLTSAQQEGAVRTDMPVQWMLSTINGLAGSTMLELAAGRVTPKEAGRLLGDTFVRSFAA